MSLHKEEARDTAVRIVDANIKFTGFDGKPEVNYYRLISDIMDALVAARKPRVIAKKRPPFVFEDD